MKLHAIPDNLPNEWATPLIEGLLCGDCLDYPPGSYRRPPCDIPGERQYCGHVIPAGDMYYVSRHFMALGRRYCLPCAAQAMAVRVGREAAAEAMIARQLECFRNARAEVG